MRNISANVAPKMNLSLRRGFNKNDAANGDPLTGADLIENCTSRIKIKREELLGLYSFLGSPNRKNLAKWKGSESRAPYDSSVLQRYFRIGEEIHDINCVISKERGVRSEDRVHFSRGFVLAAKRELSCEQYEKIAVLARKMINSGELDFLNADR